MNRGDAYEVSGPGMDKPKTSPVYGAALTVAQNRAVRSTGEGTWYVRRDNAVVAHVTRLADGVVETRPVRRSS